MLVHVFHPSEPQYLKQFHRKIPSPVLSKASEDQHISEFHGVDPPSNISTRKSLALPLPTSKFVLIPCIRTTCSNPMTPRNHHPHLYRLPNSSTTCNTHKRITCHPIGQTTLHKHFIEQLACMLDRQVFHGPSIKPKHGGGRGVENGEEGRAGGWRVHEHDGSKDLAGKAGGWSAGNSEPLRGWGEVREFESLAQSYIGKVLLLRTTFSETNDLEKSNWTSILNFDNSILESTYNLIRYSPCFLIQSNCVASSSLWTHEKKLRCQTNDRLLNTDKVLEDALTIFLLENKFRCFIAFIT